MLSTLSSARTVCDELLWDCFRINVAKAIDPNNQRSMLAFERRVANALTKAAKGSEAKALRAMLAKLNVDWPSLTQAEVSKVAAAAKRAWDKALPSAGTGGRIQGTLANSGKKVARAAKAKTVQRFKLDAGTALSEIDKRYLDAVAKNGALDATAFHGTKGTHLAKKAKKIIADGMKSGMGREGITSALRSGLPKLAEKLSQNYFRTLASYSMVTARSYGDLTAMAEGGVSRYKIEAVLDRRTTPCCRNMHGKTFEVAAAIKTLNSAAASSTPQNVTPWQYEGKDSKGQRYLYYKTPSGARRRTANINRSGYGRVDNTGSYTDKLSDTQLQARGIDTPPFHGNCRTTIIPEMDS